MSERDAQRPPGLPVGESGNGQPRGWLAASCLALLVGASAFVAWSGLSAGSLVLLALPLLLLPAYCGRVVWVPQWCLYGLILALFVAARSPGSDGLLLAVGVFTVVGLAHGELTRRNVVRSRLEEARLYQRATIDGLTGALSRASFEEFARRETLRAARYGNPLSLAVIDLDHLKRINSEAGHGAGDDALRRFGDLLRNSTRDCDCVGRLGGDEFALLMPETGLLAAAIACERLRAAVEGLESGAGAHLTASVGIAECEGAASHYEGLFEEADRCLDRAKRSGRNRVWVGPDSPAPTRPPSPSG